MPRMNDVASFQLRGSLQLRCLFQQQSMALLSEEAPVLSTHRVEGVQFVPLRTGSFAFADRESKVDTIEQQ